MGYFDYNATTPVAPQVVEAMLPFLGREWGNPSSGYGLGRRAREAVAGARRQVARLIHAEPKEVVFTSCATESINTAIRSALQTQPEKRHVVTSAVEHSATLNYCKSLQNQGYKVTVLPVDAEGRLDLGLLEKTIRPETAIVSLMWANNETGVLFPINEIGALCREKGVLFHTDGAQAAGKVEVDVKQARVDFLSLSAHKFYAPKGVGILYARDGLKLQPYLIGGHQEEGRRGGTENVPGIVAVGRAAELALGWVKEQQTRVCRLRDRLEEGILGKLPGSTRNGTAKERLPNTTNIRFEGLDAEALLLKLDQAGICVSSGSACTAGSLAPSHVLTAMGVTAQSARGAVRFSLGLGNREEEVNELLEKLPQVVALLRAASLGG